MSTIKSSNEHLTLNADGSSKDIKFQANGVEKASISSAGAFTSTTIDATKLTGNLPAISGAALTGVGVAGITSAADATAITITSDEKIGIGTTSPDMKLEVNGQIKIDSSVSGDNIMAIINSASDGYGPYFKAGGGNTSQFLFKLLTHNNTEKFRVDGDGSVLVASFATDGSTSGAKIDTTAASQTVYLSSASSTATRTHSTFVNPNGEVGFIKTTNSGTAFATSSDYRLKENVDYTWDATTRLKQLKPARFNFIADDTITVDGFLAHEAATVVPEAVTGTKDAMRDEEYEVTPAVMDGEIEVTPAVMGTRSVPDYQGIDQSKLVPLLVKTIQELEARITALEA